MRTVTMAAAGALVLALAACGTDDLPEDSARIAAPSPSPSATPETTTTPTPPPVRLPAVRARPTTTYVALGDSAAAGPVIRPQQQSTAPQCRRSERNFPSLVAAALRVGTFVDATCTSAEVSNLASPQGSVPAQNQALDQRTGLVTLGPIGANDVELIRVAADCISPGCAARQGTRVTQEIRALRPRLLDAVRAVQQRAPNAEILVIGYPRYLNGAECLETQPITPADARYVQGLLDLLNDQLRAAAQGAGVQFVDLAAVPGADRRTACAPAGTRWVEGIFPQSGDGAIAFHPTALGMRAFAATLLRTLR